MDNRFVYMTAGSLAEARTIGRDLVEIFLPEDRQQIAAFRKRVKSSESLLNYEAVRTTKDGRRIDVTLNSFPILDSSGNRVGYGGVVRDITHQTLVFAVDRRAFCVDSEGQPRFRGRK